MFDARIVQRDFSQAARDYDAHADVQRHVRVRAVSLAQELFLPGARVLDLGCGTGALAQDAPGWNLIGVDSAPGMCMVAKEKMPVINASAEALPLADNSIEAAFSSLMLQWIPYPGKVYEEVLRVLKPGGIAVFSTFVEGTLAELTEAFKVVDDRPHVSSFPTSSQLLLQAAHAGGIVLETEEYKHTQHYPDVLSLMRSLQSIGASNKHQGRQKGLFSPSAFKRVEQAYKSEGGNITASWQVLMMAIGKQS